MSDWALGKKLNSQIANVPLNHLIWLQDYKTYGVDSYVFQNKDILHELYSSPIAANDSTVFDEAYSHNRSVMTKDNFVGWYKNKYGNTTSDSLLKILLYDFSTWSDSEFSTAIEAHYNNEINISDWVKVGDKRSVTLSAMEASYVGESHVEQTVVFSIADFDHDDLETPINDRTKAAITLIQYDPLKELGYMNQSGSNSGGWESCERRSWCNDTYYNALPTYLKDSVKPVIKSSPNTDNSDAVYTTDKAFLLSSRELGRGVGSNYEGTEYAYHGVNTSAGFFLRPHRNGNTTEFYIYPASGTSYAFCGASVARCIVPCICV